MTTVCSWTEHCSITLNEPHMHYWFFPLLVLKHRWCWSGWQFLNFLLSQERTKHSKSEIMTTTTNERTGATFFPFLKLLEQHSEMFNSQSYSIPIGFYSSLKLDSDCCCCCFWGEEWRLFLCLFLLVFLSFVSMTVPQMQKCFWNLTTTPERFIKNKKNKKQEKSHCSSLQLLALNNKNVNYCQ